MLIILLLLLGSAECVPIEEPNYMQWVMPENYTGPYTYVAPFTCEENKVSESLTIYTCSSSSGHTRCEADEYGIWKCQYIETTQTLPEPNPTWEWWMGGKL